MRIYDFIVNRVLTNEADSKIIFQESITKLETMDKGILSMVYLGFFTMLVNSTVYSIEFDSKGFSMIACTTKKRVIEIKWINDYGLAVEEFFLPKGEKPED